MKTSISVTLTVALCLTSVAISANGVCAGVKCNGVIIEEIFMAPQKLHVYIQTSGTESDLECKPPSGKRITLRGTGENIRFSYTALMSAFMSGKMVDLQVINDPDATKGTRCELNGIWLHK